MTTPAPEMAQKAVENPAYEDTGLQRRVHSAFTHPSSATASPYTAGQEYNNGMDSQMMSLLIDRIDRITELQRRHTTGHYLRAYVPLDIANPAPLGFFAFSLATCLYMTIQAGLTDPTTQFMAFSSGMFFGGATMIIVVRGRDGPVLEIFRRNALGAAAFGTFGAFWLSVGVYGTIRYTALGCLQAASQAVIFKVTGAPPSQIMNPLCTLIAEAPKGLEAIFSLFGVAAVGFMVVSVVINLALPLVFFMIAMMFFLLAGGVDHRDTVGKAAGWWGIFTSALAFYVGLAMLIEDMWGREVLPLFYTKIYKKHAAMLFPRVSEHDPLSVTAGVPYKGRPELHIGDNVEAMAPTPSLASLPRGRAGGANGGRPVGAEKRPAEMV